MKLRTIAWLITLGSALFAGSALAYECTGLPVWRFPGYYLPGERVQYLNNAYENVSEEASKHDYPNAGFPWGPLGPCGGGGEPSPTTTPTPTASPTPTARPTPTASPTPPPPPPSISILGVWHCGNDYCTWSTDGDMEEFGTENRWLIDRGDGSGDPSVNLVVLSFVHPLRLLQGTTHECPLCGVPIGMTQDVVDYFKYRGIRVMLSIGGITYVDAWNQALAENATQLGLNAAAVAQELGVGIEIDYEENRNPNLDGLQAFIDAYRSVHPYDESGSDHAARLTIDLAAGDRWLIALTERATAEWLNTDNPVLDYANAMVTPRQPTADGAIGNWQEHIDGKPQYDPPIPPLAPAKFTGSLWLTGRKPIPECVDFSRSLLQFTETGEFVQTAAPNGAGTTPGMLGWMLWGGGCEGTRTLCTTPPTSCEGGMGEAATHYDIPIPMLPLRQE